MERHFEGIHTSLSIQSHPNGLIVLKITGTDVGEFGDAPRKALTALLAPGRQTDLYIDAREVYGASIEVSGEWAAWLAANRASIKSVTMLTGSRFMHITAEFVRRFSSLEDIMWISNDPAIFDAALKQRLNPPD